MNYINHKNRNIKKGFTLMEITIVLFLIGTLSSLAIINFKIGISANNLNNAENYLYQNIKLAQSNALSHRSYNEVLPKYWGVSLNIASSSFAVFADVNGNGNYDNGEADSFFGARVVKLPDGIFINRMSFDTLAINILFESGSGDMYIKNIDFDDFENEEWHIELKDRRYDIGRLIIVEPPSKIINQDCLCNDSSLYCCSFCSASSTCINFETP